MREQREVDKLFAKQGVSADVVLDTLATFGEDLLIIKQFVTEMYRLLESKDVLKEWYSTNELAEAMHVSVYTVAERWCNAGRIECEKDPDSGKWRIPGREFNRLVKGGGIKPRAR